jgi:hypothetical protein
LALLKEVNMRRIICLLILISLTLTGCANPTKEREEIIQKTFEDAKELNEKSNFGECELLDPSPDTSFWSAGALWLADDVSEYYYREYNGGIYITNIILKSNSYHVFGIRVGDDLSSVDEILTREGYKKERINNNPGQNYPVVSYTKNYISISFYIDSDNSPDKLSKIAVAADDPGMFWKNKVLP